MTSGRPTLRRLARRTALLGVRSLLSLRSRDLPRADPRGSALIVAPHPDDDVLGCGALIRTRRSQGCPVHIAYLTDGSGSHPGHPTVPPGALSEMRRNEAVQATSLLGVPRDNLHFLDLRDGTIVRLPGSDLGRRVIAQLVEIIQLTGATEVFTPLRRDGSSEHEAAFLLVRGALQKLGHPCRLYEYPIWALWNPRWLIGPSLAAFRVWHVGEQSAATDLASLKSRAIAAHRSQVEPLPPDQAPALPPGFVQCFEALPEFYFEEPMSAGASSEASRLGLESLGEQSEPGLAASRSLVP